MGSFRVLVGNMAIVATTGAAGGRSPTIQSQAVAFDVIDRRADDARRYLCRDQTFDGAWDFCTRRLASIGRRIAAN